MRWVFLFLYGFSVLLHAEENQVYNKHSQLTAENINKAVEVLRDPTVMNDNFRKALGNLSNAPSVDGVKKPSSNGELLLPDIEMVGKVISKEGTSTVVFKANDKYYHFEEGESLTKVVDHKVMTFKVLEISKHSVRVLVMPFNKILIF